MSLSQKITIVILIQLLLLAVAASLVQYHVILPIFEHLEKEQALITIQQIEERFQEDLDDLDSYLYDWSAWNDTHAFISEQNQAYIDSNLPKSTFTNADVDLILFLDEQLALLWGARLTYLPHEDDFDLNTDTESLQPLLKEFITHINAIDFAEPSSDDQVVKGIKLTGNDTYMFSVRPVYDSEAALPSNGYLLMARVIGDRLHNEYQYQLKTEFDIEKISPGQLSPETFQKYQITPLGKDRLEVSGYLTFNGNPVLKISTRIPREITLNGLKSIYTAMGSLFVIGFLSLLSIWLLLRYIALKPLNRLKTNMALIASTGEFEHTAKIRSKDEIGDLANTFNYMIDIIKNDKSKIEENNLQLQRQKAELESTQKELQLANKALTRLAKTDKLTKLANRMALDDKLANDWHTLGRLKKPLSFLMIDIDYFKQFNDNYGHQAGDECLQQIALIILGTIRRSSDLLARYGGEEFAIVLPGVEAEQACQLAAKILDVVRESNIEHKYSNVAQHVTLSIGVNCVTPSRDSSVEQLIDGADQALYQAKSNGRDQYQVA
ncbi:MAG: diguanylate cyclase [Ketobacteraceae bacterium]|nr:diguanylate cyclase [Ketobacteraceae bacterium]